MASTTATKEQSYELSLTSTLIFNVVFSAVVFVIFPIARRFFPAIFAPQQHLNHRNTGASGYWLWFIDVFQQPLSVYATRGNLATIFAVFQMMLLALYSLITLVSLTILIPAYSYGTDVSWNPNYLTFWSKITLPHIETGSLMNLVPIFAVILITVATMFFYSQFQLIYVFFRQRCLKRKIAQNYVVLLQNIPSVLDNADEIRQVLNPIKNGIKTIVPVPLRSDALTKLNGDIRSSQVKLEKMKRRVEDLSVNHLYQTARAKALIQNASDANEKEQKQMIKEAAKAKKEAEKIRSKAEHALDEFGTILAKIKQHKLEVHRIAYEDNLKTDYIFNITELPPQLPEIIQPAFDLLQRKQTAPIVKYEYETFVHQPTAYSMSRLVNRGFALTSEKADKETIGSSAFLFCESQSIAAEKYTALVSANSKQPEALLAPNPHEIVWKNMAVSNNRKLVRRIIFVIVLIALFVAYIWGQCELMGILYKEEENWHHSFFNFFCFGNCEYGKEQTGFCSMCDGFSSMLVTMIPTVLTCLLMSFLPLFIEAAVKLLCFPSVSQNKDLEYQILFIFLILIMGIVQVALPDLVDMTNGKFNINALKGLGIEQLFENLGRNVAQQQFTFVNYIINKYLTFPVFGLLNFYGMIIWAIALFKSNALDYNLDMRFITFNFGKQLAYTAHMFVVGFIFAIVAPITNVIILVTYLMMVTIDRYFILYMNVPDVTSDLSAQANMLVNVIGTIFVGLVFMLCATGCYFFIQKGAIYNFGAAVCIICLIFSILYKIVMDGRYKRALTEMARGNYQETHKLAINAAHIDTIYSDKDDYESRYDVNNPQKAEELKKLLKIKTEYKMNFFDRVLEKWYVDLTELPVSLVKVEDMKIGEKSCRILESKQYTNEEIDLTKPKVFVEEKNFIGERTERTQEEVNIMAFYSHPALLQAAQME
ncbi:Transmembrane_domain-containing protein [Hexamita inflata]|uniref:Transmembrane domain-containing protein n=1 Tax=Hexamita inflata TaxID=28002 RepID=A0AA86PY80_9EUKA|nr:Transmembrane domain-containing protein [Hexamita inflata]